MNDFLMQFWSGFLFVAIGLWVRLRPLSGNGLSWADHWYWLLCAEDVKRRHKLPPRLPYFMLEIEEQWYPPLFAGLLALLPMRWLKSHGGKISQLIDLLQGLMIFLVVFWLSNSLVIAFLSGLSYLVAWFPMSYNNQLQPRGLANLLLTFAVMGLWFFIDTGNGMIWGGVLILSLLLLFLHKMTVQMWVVYLCGFSLWAKDWRIMALLPASILLAIIVSKGFYLKILRAHWDIVSFWHKNIKNLGSHQYYESPLYRKEGFAPTAVHQKGLSHQMRKLLGLFQYNVFIIFLPILIYSNRFYHPSEQELFLWWWLGLTYLWALLTTFMPYFKALGSGIYYLYQSFFPLFLLASLVIPQLSISLQWLFFSLWGVALFLSGALWKKQTKTSAIGSGSGNRKDLLKVLDYLRGLPKEGIFCIPFILSDMAAYWTHKKVFWGGHSYGFNTMLKPYFPIMRENVIETLKRKSLNYLLVGQGYLGALQDIGIKEGVHVHRIFSSGGYELYGVYPEEP